MLPGFHDFFDVAEREIILSNTDIDPAEIRRPGSDANLVVNSAATMADQLAQACRRSFADLYFDSARGDGLAKLGRDRYRLVPFGASVSRGHLTFYRNDVTAGCVSIDRSCSCGDSDGHRIESIESVTISDYGPVNARAVTKETGSLANIRTGQVRQIYTQLDDKNIRVTNAIAVAKFERAVAGASGTIPVSTQLRDGYGNTYRTMEDLAFTASQTVGLVPIEIDGGHGFNAAVEADTITTIVDTLFDTFTVNNPVATGGAFSGGDDDETDGNFALRCTKFFESARRGTQTAIWYGALSVPGVRHVQVYEEVLESHPTRAVHVLVADVNGIGSDALVAEVLTMIDQYRSGGIAVFVTGGQIEELALAFRLGAATGYDSTLLAEEVTNISKEYLFGLPPSTGETDYANLGIVQHSAIIDRLKAVEGLYVPYNAITTPTSDYVPVRGNSARSSGVITLTWI